MARGEGHAGSHKVIAGYMTTKPFRYHDLGSAAYLPGAGTKPSAAGPQPSAADTGPSGRAG